MTTALALVAVAGLFFVLGTAWNAHAYDRGYEDGFDAAHQPSHNRTLRRVR